MAYEERQSPSEDPMVSNDPWSSGGESTQVPSVDGALALDYTNRRKGDGKKGQGGGQTGKGAQFGQRKPLDCLNCDGLGHPGKVCTSAPGAKLNKTSPKCNLCGGWGHVKAGCASEGGGKYRPPPAKGEQKGAQQKGSGGQHFYGKGMGRKGVSDFEQWRGYDGGG